MTGDAPGPNAGVAAAPAAPAPKAPRSPTPLSVARPSARRTALLVRFRMIILTSIDLAGSSYPTQSLSWRRGAALQSRDGLIRPAQADARTRDERRRSRP